MDAKGELAYLAALVNTTHSVVAPGQRHPQFARMREGLSLLAVP
ncbi:hypothetical protein ADILRU_0616 [Leifsonia rubra CMS 76R]|nr:hypothetical protein ADILRU_0616 [Leifsonia rubra CMS 76R]